MKRPYMCVRDTVVFPQATQGLFIGRESTLRAIDLSESDFDKEIVLLTQKKCELKNPNSMQDIFRIGTLCKIVGLVRLQDGMVKARFQGIGRFKLSHVDFKSPTPLASGSLILERKENKKKIDEIEKRNFTELFVRAKPFVIFDEDTTCLKDFKAAKNEKELSQAILYHLRYSRPIVQKKAFMKFNKKQLVRINNRTRLEQQILESKNSGERLKKLKEYLISEVMMSLA